LEIVYNTTEKAWERGCRNTTRSSYPGRAVAPFGGMNDHPTKQEDTVIIALFPGHSPGTYCPKVIALKY